MDVRLAEDPAEFAERAGGFLALERYSANVIAVHLGEVRAGRRPLAEDALWITLESGGSVVGAAMHTPPHPLFLPRLGPGAADALADVLSSHRRPLTGVSGEQETVLAFRERWAFLGGSRGRLRTSMRLYVLGDLRVPEVPGRARLGTLEEASLAAGWLRAFDTEAMPAAPAAEVAEVARHLLAARRLWMWESDGEVVALAGVSEPAAGVARVGPVYTPPGQRRRGYGSAVTAAASSAALRGGADDVVLYTDLANPTSNSIYQAIGYRPDHDAGEWVLD
ncbi:MAG TPA: GNAT family N-acetyltransferase [Acidimicrobiales bacterium]|nr:GNAT family N-acetyltransferase [Acidimicrobiales bacterium]